MGEGDWVNSVREANATTQVAGVSPTHASTSVSRPMAATTG
jgi:hypothetical protein